MKESPFRFMDKEVRGQKPRVHNSCFVAPTADLIGDVIIGAQSSVWFQCVLRGDVMPISIGERTNIQDGTVIHGTFERYGVTIGDEVTVGHKVMLHGCTLGDRAFVGMGSIVLDGAKVASESFLGAGALLPQGFETRSGWLYLGQPAKPIRKLKDSEMEFLSQSAQNYIKYTSWYGSFQ